MGSFSGQYQRPSYVLVTTGANNRNGRPEQKLRNLRDRSYSSNFGLFGAII